MKSIIKNWAKIPGVSIVYFNKEFDICIKVPYFLFLLIYQKLRMEMEFKIYQEETRNEEFSCMYQAFNENMM